MADYPEPPWTADPQNVFCEPSAMCTLGPSPSRITGFLVRAIQAHFYDPDNIVDEVLRNAIWTKDTVQETLENRILVGAARAYSAKDIQQRPAVLVLPGDTASTRMALMDGGSLTLNEHGALPGQYHLRKMNGQHIVRCLAKGEMAAYRLAEEVFFRLTVYSPMMQEDMAVGDFQVAGLGSPKEVDESSLCYAVDITIVWALMYEWNVSQIAPVFEKLAPRA